MNTTLSEVPESSFSPRPSSSPLLPSSSVPLYCTFIETRRSSKTRVRAASLFSRRDSAANRDALSLRRVRPSIVYGNTYKNCDNTRCVRACSRISYKVREL
ncbi:hypothetical protein PUN28_014444 [Cardiocondyla obscurior]|uniref:Uncharacterized protein n=1 Tax=Cardiocondyla obscurior TaxID=286306 RepID=A0AAW2F3C6_9HYME